MVFTLWKCLLSVGSWNSYSDYMVRNKYDLNEYKLALNKVSATHAYICLLIIGLVSYNILSDQWLIYWSMGFYISDTVTLLSNKLNIVTLLYLYHHIISIAIINLVFYDKFKQDTIDIIFLAEISNLPLYVVYHLKKKNLNDQLYKICLYIEIVQYSFFRIFGLGYYLYYRIYSNYDSIILTNCIVLYMMGVYWSIQLCKSAPFLKLNRR